LFGLFAGIFSLIAVFGFLVVGVAQGERIGYVFGLIWLGVAVVSGTIVFLARKRRSHAARAAET